MPEIGAPKRIVCVASGGMRITPGTVYNVLDSDTDAMILYYKVRDDDGKYIWLSGEFFTEYKEAEPCKN